jgi:hypothetical protein
MNLGSGKLLLDEARRIQFEFLINDVYWKLEKCLDAVIGNETTETNVGAIDSARIVARAIDREEETV